MTMAGKIVCAAAVFGLAGVFGLETRGEEMPYGKVRGFLSEHTRVVELSGERGARVAVCPEWQGRVMTSTCGGDDGPSFGFVNRSFIEAGKLDPRFNNYGAEDRMWLSPEAGRFSLWFAPGEEQTLSNWCTPPALNEGPCEVTSAAGDASCRMSRRMKLRNASAAQFDLAVTREVRLLGGEDLERLFGRAAGPMLAGGVRRVAYETVNSIRNCGPDMNRDDGMVSIWVLGMLNAGPETVVVVPYRPGEEALLGPAVKSDYFGQVPADRLKILPEAILLRADGEYRAKIGTSQRRAKNVLGSIDFASGTLTLVQFTMPDDPTRCDYMNNSWGLDALDPYIGDVANAYNDGPPSPGVKGMGAFYEIESLSPAAALGSGQSLTHCHRTMHFEADRAVLDEIARAVFGVGLERIEKEMLPGGR